MPATNEAASFPPQHGVQLFMGDSRGRRVCVIVGALTGVVVTALAAAHFGKGHINMIDVVMPTWMSAAGGGLSGALCGFLVWALAAPRRRVPRAAIFLAA